MSIGIPLAQKSKLDKNRVMLVQNLYVDEIFLTIFRRGNVITENTKEEIECVVTRNGRAAKLLSAVEGNVKRHTFQRLVEAMVETGQRDLAEHLDPGLTADYLVRREKILETNEVDTDEIDSVFLHDNEIIKEIGIGVPLPDGGSLKLMPKMSVKVIPISEERRRKLHEQPGTYEISFDRSRRRAIILNNMYFVSLKNRGGTEKDQENLNNLLDQLNFTTQLLANVDSGKMVDKLRKEAEEINKLPSVDILVVFMMSHGCMGSIIGTDEKAVPICPDIMEIFGSRNCPNLRDKPKLFFIQACRSEDDNSRGRALTDDVKKYPDTLLAYGTCSGYVSLRKEALGSWFMRAIVTIFSKYAHEQDVETMMQQVCRIVSRMKSKDNRSQTPESYCTLSKRCHLLT